LNHLVEDISHKYENLQKDDQEDHEDHESHSEKKIDSIASSEEQIHFLQLTYILQERKDLKDQRMQERHFEQYKGMQLPY
jgi:hypothetical protein